MKNKNNDRLKVYKPHSDSVAGKIIAGVDAGIERSITEWSQHLECSESYIALILNYLRKKGYQFRPVVETQGVAGKVRDLSKSRRDSSSTMLRLNANQVRPMLEAAIMMALQTVRVFPELITVIQPLQEDSLRLMLNGKHAVESEVSK